MSKIKMKESTLTRIVERVLNESNKEQSLQNMAKVFDKYKKAKTTQEKDSVAGEIKKLFKDDKNLTSLSNSLSDEGKKQIEKAKIPEKMKTLEPKTIDSGASKELETGVDKEKMLELDKLDKNELKKELKVAKKEKNEKLITYIEDKIKEK